MIQKSLWIFFLVRRRGEKTPDQQILSSIRKGVRGYKARHLQSALLVADMPAPFHSIGGIGDILQTPFPSKVDTHQTKSGLNRGSVMQTFQLHWHCARLAADPTESAIV